MPRDACMHEPFELHLHGFGLSLAALTQSDRAAFPIFAHELNRSIAGRIFGDTCDFNYPSWRVTRSERTDAGH